MFKLTKTYLTRETNKVMKGLIRHREVLDCWVGDSWSKAYINSERKVKSLSKEVDTFNKRRQELVDAERVVRELKDEVAELKIKIAEYESGVLWLWSKMNDR